MFITYCIILLLTCFIYISVPAPVIQPIPNQNVTVGLDVTFSCIATGFGLTYSWDYPYFRSFDANITGVDTPTLTISPATNRINGTYTCTVTDFTGVNTSSEAQLNVLGKLTIRAFLKVKCLMKYSFL